MYDLGGGEMIMEMILLEMNHHRKCSNTDNMVMISSHVMVVGNDPQYFHFYQHILPRNMNTK